MRTSRFPRQAFLTNPTMLNPAALCVRRLDPNDYVRGLRAYGDGDRAWTHLALVRVGGAVRRCYIKAFRPKAPRGLINEIVGHTLGHHAGLPQPECALILVTRTELARMHPDVADGPGTVPCFVSLEAHDPRDARQGMAKALYNWNNQVAQQALRARMLRWAALPLVMAFDCWVANVDRNLGNLIFDGANSAVVIDHSDVLSGCAWQAADLVPAHEFANKLLAALEEAGEVPLPTKSAIVSKAGGFLAAYGKARSELDHWLRGESGSPGLCAHHFVWHRAEHSPQLLRDRLRVVV